LFILKPNGVGGPLMMKKVEKDYVIYGLVVLFLLLLVYMLATRSDKSSAVHYDERVEIKEQPRAAVTPQDNVTFCFRLNGREDMHLPALLGGAGSDVYPNGLAGFNWSLSPQSSGSEPYGVLEDGTIFIKVDFLSRWDPNKVELKADMTGWRPEELTLSTVNKEPAYVYKIYK